jgi:hypothetical protein
MLYQILGKFLEADQLAASHKKFGPMKVAFPLIILYYKESKQNSVKEEDSFHAIHSYACNQWPSDRFRLRLISVPCN